MHRMLPFTPSPRTAIENRSPAEKPVQIKNRITAAFLNFVKADPSSTKNGKRRTCSKYQIYSPVRISAARYCFKKYSLKIPAPAANCYASRLTYKIPNKNPGIKRASSCLFT